MPTLQDSTSELTHGKQCSITPFNVCFKHCC